MHSFDLRFISLINFLRQTKQNGKWFTQSVVNRWEILYFRDAVYPYFHKQLHYANMSAQYTAIFHGCKNENFQMKIFDIFLIFAQNIDCRFTLEPPQRGGSNEYPQSMFLSKNMYTRVNPTFSI